MLFKTFTVLYLSSKAWFILFRGGFGDCHVAYKLESLNKKHIWLHVYSYLLWQHYFLSLLNKYGKLFAQKEQIEEGVHQV